MSYDFVDRCTESEKYNLSFSSGGEISSHTAMSSFDLREKCKIASSGGHLVTNSGGRLVIRPVCFCVFCGER